MGLYGDDHTRNKNKLYSAAIEIYDDLKAMGYSDQDIIKYLRYSISHSHTTQRNSVFSVLLSMLEKQQQ